jgi:hypothetical protein
MRFASVIFGLPVGCAISGATGYWTRDNIDAAPVGTFLWVHTFKLTVDSALVLPLLIMFVCVAVSCMPDILPPLSSRALISMEPSSIVVSKVVSSAMESVVSSVP